MANLLEGFFVEIGAKDNFSNTLKTARKSYEDTSKQAHNTARAIKDSSSISQSSLVGLRSGFIALAAVTALAAAGISKAFSGVKHLSDMKRQADMIGFTTEQVKALEMAGKKLGANDGVLTSFASKLAQTKELLKSGASLSGTILDASGVNSLRHHKADFDKLAYGSQDEQFREISRVLKQVEKAYGMQRAILVATENGIDASLVPAMLKGENAVNDVIHAQEKLSRTSNESAKQAQELERGITSLSNGFDAISQTILNHAIPSLVSLAEQFGLDEKHAAETTENMVNLFESFTSDLIDRMSLLYSSFTNEAKDAYDKTKSFHDMWMDDLFGVENAAKVKGFFDGVSDSIVGGVKSFFGGDTEASAGAQDVSTPYSEQPTTKMNYSKSEATNAKNVMSYLMNKHGLPKNQAAAIAANIKAESNFKVGAVGDGGLAKGAIQWHPDRRKAYKEATGIDVLNQGMEGQLDMIVWEMGHGGFNHGRNKGSFLRASSAASAASMMSKDFVRPHDVSGEAMKRARVASGYANMDMGGNSNSTTNMSINNVQVHANDPQEFMQGMRKLAPSSAARTVSSVSR